MLAHTILEGLRGQCIITSRRIDKPISTKLCRSISLSITAIGLQSTNELALVGALLSIEAVVGVRTLNEL